MSASKYHIVLGLNLKVNCRDLARGQPSMRAWVKDFQQGSVSPQGQHHTAACEEVLHLRRFFATVKQQKQQRKEALHFHR